MRKCCLHVFFVLIIAAMFVGCGSGGTTSVPPAAGMEQSGEAAGRKALDSSAAGQPNTGSAMPSYYGQGYPTGQGQSGGYPGGGQPGGGQQPGR
jgi:hypothetical protein